MIPLISAPRQLLDKWDTPENVNKARMFATVGQDHFERFFFTKPEMTANEFNLDAGFYR